MRFLRLLPLLILLAFALPAIAQDTMADIVVYSRDTGRVVFKLNGDSTSQRNLKGHAYAGAAGLMHFSQAAGLYMPANATSGNNVAPGMYEARRHKNSATVGGMVFSAGMVNGGYPATYEQYGPGIPLIGTGYQTTTLNEGGSLSATDVTITVANAALLESAPSWIIIESAGLRELVFYAGKSVNNLTGCQRGQYSLASIHTDGTTVRQATLWNGPAPAFLGTDQLNGGILIGDVMAGAGVITVDDTSQFTVWPTSAGAGSATIVDANRVYMHDGTNVEIFTYTGKTSTTLTGVTRANLGTAARAWADNTRISQCLSGANPAGLLYPSHPLGPSGQLKHSTWWISTLASSANGATILPALTSQPTQLNSDGTRTAITTGSAVNMTGTAVGTLNKTVITGAQADRSTLTIMFAASDAVNGRGPFGPAIITQTGLFAGARPTGVIQAMGDDLGSHTLSKKLFYQDRITASGSNPYRTSLLTEYKMFLDAGDADVGGNGNVMLCLANAWGHNECGSGGGFYGPADTRAGKEWTIAGISDAAGSYPLGTETTIAITDIGTLPGSNFFVRINDEYIFVASQSGGTLTGCIRGMLGSTPASINIFDVVYVGYPTFHPRGFAADVLFDYETNKALWISAGGTEATYKYLYVRPIPCSASPSVVADTSATSSDAEREYKLQRFTAEIESRLSGLPGFIVVDALDDFASGEPVTYQNGSGTDQIHNEASFYETYWIRLLGYNVFGAGAGNDAIGGGGRRGLRGRPRVGIRKTKRRAA